MGTLREDVAEFAETKVRAVEVTVGSVTGWQVQQYDSFGQRWTSCNVMCSKEQAEEEVARRRENLVSLIMSQQP